MPLRPPGSNRGVRLNDAHVLSQRVQWVGQGENCDVTITSSSYLCMPLCVLGTALTHLPVSSVGKVCHVHHRPHCCPLVIGTDSPVTATPVQPMPFIYCRYCCAGGAAAIPATAESSAQIAVGGIVADELCRQGLLPGQMFPNGACSRPPPLPTTMNTATYVCMGGCTHASTSERVPPITVGPGSMHGTYTPLPPAYP
jgi:hypothetical protein